MLTTPLLSLVVAVYNGEKFLNVFFASIVSQALTNYELIIVNDGSTDASAEIMAEWQSTLSHVQIIHQPNQGVSVARNSGLKAATGKYVAFPDIDDKIYPGMYATLLEMAEKNALDVASCNGRYFYENGKESRPIFPLSRLRSTPVLTGPEWLKKALDSRKFLHVTWLNIYRRDFLQQHNFTFEPGLRHQDIVWTTEVLLAAARVQYTDKQLYDYYIHSESVSHKPDTDESLIRSVRHYMKIVSLLDQINQRHAEQVKHIRACRWQIAKEGLGIFHTFDNIQDVQKKTAIIKEFFANGSWEIIWRNAHDLRLRWRLARRYWRLRKVIHT